MNNLRFKWDADTFEVPFTEVQIRGAIQEAIAEFISTGGDNEAYESGGRGGVTFFRKEFPDIGLKIAMDLCEGLVSIAIEFPGFEYALDGVFDPTDNTITADCGDSQNAEFFKSELEQIQVAIDKGLLRDVFGKHHKRK
jgi:hypothetical protein